tara:strand:- start:1238 stop:1447 length:210 start_codon:yes stop_codon:yes gene_type:complete
MQKIPGEVMKTKARVWNRDEGTSVQKNHRSSFERAAGDKEKERAARILRELEEACQRMDRLIKVFDRMA